jgi:hypothetical protein
MSENLGDHYWIFDGGDDLQGVAELEAMFNIGMEHPLSGWAQLMWVRVPRQGSE